jgi:phospholipase/carboxylesterase
MLRALIRRPQPESDRPPVLVLLHGLGADADDLMGLAPELDPGLLVVSIEAPLEYGNGGYAWFEVQWRQEGVFVDSEQALASRDLLIGTIEQLPAGLNVEPSALILAGFSQGAMMSIGVALARPDLVSGVVSMSGRLVPEFVAGAVPDASKVPYLVQHGKNDPVLPIEGSREIRDYLEGLGCEVTYREYPMAHEISMPSLADVRRWIGDHLRPRL